MYLSIGIILYLVLMAYWWGNQGFFSSLMHLLTAIAAGSLALALWEPLTVNFFFAGKFSGFAWSAGLLGPFVMFFLIIRITLDLTVRKNLYFNEMINWLAGGLCGLFSGIIISGILVIGLGYMPLTPDIFGYEPFKVESDGRVVGHVNDTSWWPVNQQASGVFTLLSGGSFSSGTAMSTYKPDLAGQSARHRMRYDANSSLVAAPQEVEVTQAAAAPTPLGGFSDAVFRLLGPAARSPGMQLVTVTTRLKGSGKGTYDSDGALRLPPTQVRLLTVPSANPEGEGQLHAPVAYTHIDDNTQARILQAVNDAKSGATGRSSPTDLTWTFMVPADRRPRFILVRHTRFELPSAIQDRLVAIKDMGNPPGGPVTPITTVGVGASTNNDPTQVSGLGGPKTMTIARRIAVSGRLPAELSKNVSGSLECEGTAVRSGRADVPQVQGALVETVRIDSIWVPKFASAVCVEVDRDTAQSLLGAARVAAASLGGLWLKDTNGREHLPIAYAWRNKNNVTRVHVKEDYNDPFKSAREFPVTEMAVGETIFIYFSVPKGTTLTEFRMGKDSFQKLEPPMVVPNDPK